MRSSQVESFIALGGNLPGPSGDVLATFRQALSRMESLGIHVIRVSSAYRTEAWVPEGDAQGAPDHPDYWNAVCSIRTRLAPCALLAALLALEKDAGRVRAVRRFAPRPLDLDILTYGARVIDVPGELTVPHPRLHERPFVLQPWLEIAPDAVVPRWNVTVRELVRQHADPFAGIREMVGTP